MATATQFSGLENKALPALPIARNFKNRWPGGWPRVYLLSYTSTLLYSSPPKMPPLHRQLSILDHKLTLSEGFITVHTVILA